MTTEKKNWMPVLGACPSCGKRSLRAAWGPGKAQASIECGFGDCERPTAVQEVLDGDHPEHHVLHAYEDTWSIEHPLIERLNGVLFDCPVHQQMRDEDGPPRGGPGVYKVRLYHADGASSSFRGVSSGLEFERVGDLPIKEIH